MLRLNGIFCLHWNEYKIEMLSEPEGILGCMKSVKENLSQQKGKPVPFRNLLIEILWRVSELIGISNISCMKFQRVDYLVSYFIQLCSEVTIILQDLTHFITIFWSNERTEDWRDEIY